MDLTAQNLPTVSIGMPTYNRPQELRRALKAVVEQTYPHLEIIVSDNASPGEEVEAVVKEFMSRDKRIQYYRQTENYGPEHNFQFVLDKATGEFFMWASDDDWRAPEFVAELVTQLTNHPEASLAFCNFIAARETGEQVSGYPDFLSMMKRFAVDSTTFRQVKFFLQNERAGKANLIYGLIRKRFLHDFKLDVFFRKSGRYGADMLFVFWLLGRGALALSEKKLYHSTVENKKNYEVGKICKEAWMKPLMSKFTEQMIYSFQYILVSAPRQRPILSVLWPIKVIQLIGSMLWQSVKR
jgi:glycosyltransferase involved in cell wall biosynthesis